MSAQINFSLDEEHIGRKPMPNLVFLALALIVLCFFLWAPTHSFMTHKPLNHKRTTRLGRTRKTKRIHNRKIDLGLLLSEVATRLRAGSGLEDAWRIALSRLKLSSLTTQINDDGVPQFFRSMWAQTSSSILSRQKLPFTTSDIRIGVPAAITICKMSHRGGTPAADIFETCARGVTQANEALAARSIALAGPQSSAQMISLLPLLGVILGTLLGADPLDFLLHTTPGHICLACGVVFEIVGLVWIRALIHHAERESL